MSLFCIWQRWVSVIISFPEQNQTLKAITKDDMEHVKVEENQVNTFLMTFQELNDISIKFFNVIDQ